jgi:hypothetical protein
MTRAVIENPTLICAGDAAGIAHSSNAGNTGPTVFTIFLNILMGNSIVGNRRRRTLAQERASTGLDEVRCPSAQCR